MPTRTKTRTAEYARLAGPRLRSRIIAIERGWFAKQKSYFGILRRIPEDLWIELMDMLPRCYCGRIVSPHRAIMARAKNSFCTPKCQKRMTARKYDAMRRYISKEQEAIAASIWQAGLK